ncbi:hypothetical protein BCR42DRAFT_413537 [Absidia repens]|uniref:VHS domain-containing protein n=1 Tax=Absidia repens TaxID=90262 RepID=A0A1X2II19_9FUNG|nr:hypothetical protein BCR42DRAFT_413537 [Absidia repens]
MKFSLQDPEHTEFVQLLDKATDGNTASEDWSLFITICHKINQSPQATKTTRKVLQKKLAGMVPQTQILSIALLKVITENCRRFDEQLGHETLIRTLRIVWNHPQTYSKVRERIMECTFVWTMELGGYQPVHPIILYCQEINQCYPATAATPLATAWTSPSPLPGSKNHAASTNTTVNRKSSLFSGWKLKRNSQQIPATSSQQDQIPSPPAPQASQTPQIPQAQVPPSTPPTPPTHQPQDGSLMISGHDQTSENNSQKIQSCIEESKSTSNLLHQLLSNDQIQPDDLLLQELFQKCQDLQSNLMRYLQSTSDPVYIGTLIDTNSLLYKVIEAYNKRNDRDENLPDITMTEKALGKRPIRQNGDLRV